MSDASVNLATNRAAFSCDPTKVKLTQVREAIAKRAIPRWISTDRGHPRCGAGEA
ncbi:MAG: hypothetical protein R2912_10170 [Eubacteriales bacterium]